MSARVSSGSDSKQDYGTPWPFIEAVERRFGPLAIDLAATATNKRAPLYYGPEQDSLSDACEWPASIGSNWFAEHVHRRALVLGLNGPRLKFEGSPDPYPKDLMLVCYGESPGFDVWRWR